MRARFAYISSLGTTAILIGAALLMLALVSALVAYRGWPGGAGDGGVQAIPLAPGQSTRPVALVRPTNPAPRGLQRSGGRTSRLAASTVGLVKSKPGAKGPRTVPGLVMVPVSASPTQPGLTTRSPEPQQPVTPASAASGVPSEAETPSAALPGAGGGIPAVALPDVPQPPVPAADQVSVAISSALGGGDSPPAPIIAAIFGGH